MITIKADTKALQKITNELNKTIRDAHSEAIQNVAEKLKPAFLSFDDVETNTVADKFSVSISTVMQADNPEFDSLQREIIDESIEQALKEVGDRLNGKLIK